MNAITNLTGKIAIAAVLAGVPILSGCNGGAAATHSDALPMLASGSSARPHSVNCGPACAVLIEPLKAKIADGVLSLTASTVYCREPIERPEPILVPEATTVSVTIENTSEACIVSGRVATGYFIVAAPAEGVRTNPGPLSLIAGPNVSPAPIDTIVFDATTATLPAGELIFYLAYCTNCGF